ncbi:hypothetical protein, partial [Enterobacter hormaechei]
LRNRAYKKAGWGGWGSRRPLLYIFLSGHLFGPPAKTQNNKFFYDYAKTLKTLTQKKKKKKILILKKKKTPQQKKKNFFFLYFFK